MEIMATELPGLKIIRPKIFRDARGAFIKTFHRDFFREHGIGFEPLEEFFSTSAKNVLRGMHFQAPPAAHAKLVYCLAGRVLDVVLDLRRNSPTFGRSCARELNAASHEIFFIPIGFAHGFLALEDDSMMLYQTSSVHSPAHDAGVRWDSFGFAWPVENPILSERDRTIPAFRDFSSPFEFA
jgi:dTDP-4-dehydrorhamnose 3,5-epimerase